MLFDIVLATPFIEDGLDLLLLDAHVFGSDGALAQGALDLLVDFGAEPGQDAG